MYVCMYVCMYAYIIYSSTTHNIIRRLMCVWHFNILWSNVMEKNSFTQTNTHETFELQHTFQSGHRGTSYEIHASTLNELKQVWYEFSVVEIYIQIKLNSAIFKNLSVSSEIHRIHLKVILYIIRAYYNQHNKAEIWGYIFWHVKTAHAHQCKSV